MTNQSMTQTAPGGAGMASGVLRDGIIPGNARGAEMSSPFPATDPYIEAYGDWLDFRGAFTSYCCDYLNERLLESYVLGS
jgi:hypothetical protein